MKTFLLIATLAVLFLSVPGVSRYRVERIETVNVAAFQASAVATEIASAAAQADFDLMRKALEEAHGGIYRYSTKSEMDRYFAAQRSKLNRSMTKREFLAFLVETLAALRCGHTGVTPDSEMQTAATNARKLPLRVMLEGRRLMVISNDTTDNQTILPGMEIVEINGRKPSDIVDRIIPTLATDGDIETGKRVRLQRNLALYYWLLVEQVSDFTVKAKNSAGKTVTATLAGVTDADRQKSANPVNAEAKASIEKLEGSRDNLSLKFHKGPEIAHIRIRGFGGRDYPKWIEDTFRTLQEKGTKTLIIDMRANGGGQDMYGAMLVSYLTAKPFSYFDHINLKTISPSFKVDSDWRVEREGELRQNVTTNPSGGYLIPTKMHPGVGVQQPGKHPFLGKVFILIDGGTFSTAADFCAVTHHLKRATFIGEESGGGYYGNNSGMQTILTLPNSKFRVRIPMYEYWNAVPGYDGKRRGTRPDHLVETKTANLLRGIDEQLDMALRLAAQIQ